MKLDRSPRFLRAMLALSTAALLSACEVEVVTSEDAEVYVAQLRPLNPGFAGNISGTATFTIDLGNFQAEVDATGLDNTVHPQHIHAAASCPTTTLERANDGDDILDMAEGIPAYGPILIPLDDILTEITPGEFPQGSTIDYRQRVRLSVLEASSVAFRPRDAEFTNLGPREELNLEGRTVVLYGVSRNVPASVRSIPGLPANLSVPVACGTIERVTG